MISFVLLITCFMFVFPNALFYTSVLLVATISLLVFIVSSNFIRLLIFLLILIVYVGAIIILIGYICAVCPNLVLDSNYGYLFIIFSFVFLVSLVLSPSESFLVLSPSKQGTLLDYFFSSWGVFTFILITFILFSTLLIVTSQYVSPQGPFRSTT